MAERPILKSERAASQPDVSSSDASQSDTPTQKRNVPKPVKKGDRKPSESGGQEQDPTQGHWTDSMDGGRGKGGRKGKGKGKGKGRGEKKAPMNPALMRGPRPTAKVEEPETQEVVTEDTAAEVSAEVSTDVSADTGADTVAASADAATADGVPTTEDSAEVASA